MKDKKLTDKTPKWFEYWHLEHFSPVSDRTKRNERWIYIIITAIIGSGILANGNTDDIASFIRALVDS
ncbi:hypothetical protein LCGC14_1438060 [marine sediment metagenome]|uniref:Uncharacterized protein n=1 Tax=marine sediment metagenome TaxID=412755 RepID=A0A0F9M201_9ZZZZ